MGVREVVPLLSCETEGTRELAPLVSCDTVGTREVVPLGRRLSVDDGTARRTIDDVVLGDEIRAALVAVGH